MTVSRHLVIVCVTLLLLAGSGCERKKHSQLPAQAKNPVEPIPSPLPSKISEEEPAPPPAPPQQETEAKAEEQRPPAKRRKPRKPPAPTVTAQSNSATPAPPPASNTNALAVAHPPGNPAEPPADTAIAADVSNAQLTQQKQNTAQLLEATEKTIGGLHNLSPEQGEMVTQIRSYVAQSKKATTEGDFERAFNLATKAHLLTDALVKK